MNAESIVTISAAVVALVQLCKWAGLRDAFGPLAVLLVSAAGVAVFLFGGTYWPPERTDTWPIFSGWIAVATSAAGVFGFTRAAVSAVTSAAPPPAPPAGEPTERKVIDASGYTLDEIVAAVKAEMVRDPEGDDPPRPLILSDDEVARRHMRIG